MKVKEIQKKLNNKIKKSKIYEIFNLYFYGQEFLKWLKHYINKESQTIDGNFEKRWQFIQEFEKTQT